jgi:hypothetical protein
MEGPDRLGGWVAIVGIWVGIAILRGPADSARGGEGKKQPAPFVIIARDAISHAPVDCVNAILLKTKYGSVTDSTGIGRVFCPNGGVYRLMLKRSGYRDTAFVVRFAVGRSESLRCELQRSGGRVPSCSEALGDPGLAPEPAPEVPILKP